MHQVLAVYGDPGDEDRGGFVLVRDGDRVYDELSGEDVDREQVESALVVVRGYVERMEAYLRDTASAG